MRKPLLLPKTFRYGVHPEERKDRTASLPIERMPFVDRYVLPLGQGAGKPARPVVVRGERVERGQLIAEAQGFVSTDLHSPVTGRIAEIGPRRHPRGDLADALEIEADLFSAQRLLPRAPIEPESLSLEGFIGEVQRAGLVGMGGAAFPTHVKFKLPEGKRVRRLVINGCECEPYLTCDHRLMVERPGDVVRGLRIVAAKLGAERSTIGVELNKPASIEALREVIGSDDAIEVAPLRVKYPQGAEKMLIEALFGEEVPAGKLPLDIDTLVNNVGTMVGIADHFDRGQPLIERVVTVSGPGIERPANLIVPVGTPVRAVLDHCGLTADTRQVVLGGPMMGQPISSLDVPVLKGTGGILAFTEGEISEGAEYHCIRCGQCLEACGNFLNPSRLARLARAGMFEEMEKLFAEDCMECGACSWVCPSRVPIVHLIRVAKAEIRRRRAREG
ncbi:MAG: electron transport complex subunit RsxC [Planctomycetota bacterium]